MKIISIRNKSGPSRWQPRLQPVLAAIAVVVTVAGATLLVGEPHKHNGGHDTAEPLPAHRSTASTVPAPSPSLSRQLRHRPDPSTVTNPSSIPGPGEPVPGRGTSTASPGPAASGPNRDGPAAGPSSDSPSPGPSASPALHPEEAYNKNGVPTFEDYSNASGQGPDIAFTQIVQITCKIYDPSIPSVTPAGYWYLIASAPWDNNYYAAANTFLNGLSPSDPNTNYYDPRVPNC
jgi:hypothetical protein